MPVVEEGVRGLGDGMNYCTCEVVPEELASVDVPKYCPQCQGWVKFLSREEFEQILEAECDRSGEFGTSEGSGPVGTDWVFGLA